MSTTSIIPYSFEGKEIQVFVALDGEPRWIAPGICKALGYTNISQTINTYVDPEDRGYIDTNAVNIPPISPVYTPGSTLVVNESGLYALIFGSSKPEAKRLKRWVTSEVMPSIRKTGTFSVGNISPLEIAKQMIVAMEQQERRIAAIEHQEAEQNQQIKQIEARQDTLDHFYTVMAWANITKRHPSKTDAQRIGRVAAKYSRTHNYNIGQAKHETFGFVRTYHEEVLKIAFEYWFTQNPLFYEDI